MLRSRITGRRMVPWAALSLSLLWGAAVGVAIYQSDVILGVLSGVGMALTLAVTVVRFRQDATGRNLAETDPLTGLLNHRGFHQALGEELAAAADVRRPLTLVALDLDDFKSVNERHGHPFGDEVLQQVAEQLRLSVRGDDVAARTGGEEFALILPGSNARAAQEVTERIRAAITDLSPSDLPLSCSAGVAAYPVDADTPSSLLQMAEGALYWAKRSGKSRTRRFDPDHVRLTGDASQRSEIQKIMANDAIEPVFQPVASLTSGKLLGYEALARFPDAPERPPSTWFAQANACGLGPELEAAAIRAALAVPGRPVDVNIAVNISPSALSSEPVRRSLPTDLTGIVIELTEHEVYVGDTLLANTIAELRERGARIAIDDAGAGYAGLKQIMWVRPDVVKLDLELTRSIHADSVRIALVESLVRFAAKVGATVCAEGVENFDDIEVLADLDVPCGQGFAIGRPAPPWSAISFAAAEICRTGLERALAGDTPAVSAGDQRLERLSARLASARDRADLQSVLGLIAGELNADKISLSAWHADYGTVETLAESGEQAEDEAFDLVEYPATARMLDRQEACQVLVNDTRADVAEASLLATLGYGSLLMVPVVQRGESVGMVEALVERERPWTRTEITRARIIANQLAGVIHTLTAEPQRRL